MCKDMYFIRIMLIAKFVEISLWMIATWLHQKIKNKTLAQSYKFQTSPSMKILSTNNPKRGFELKVLESQGECSKAHQWFHQVNTAVQGELQHLFVE
jgi:hypothetical protein